MSANYGKEKRYTTENNQTYPANVVDKGARQFVSVNALQVGHYKEVSSDLLNLTILPKLAIFKLLVPTISTRTISVISLVSFMLAFTI